MTLCFVPILHTHGKKWIVRVRSFHKCCREKSFKGKKNVRNPFVLCHAWVGQLNLTLWILAIGQILVANAVLRILPTEAYVREGENMKIGKEWKCTLVLLKSVFQSANEFLFQSNVWPLKADDFSAYYRVGQFGISKKDFLKKDRAWEILAEPLTFDVQCGYLPQLCLGFATVVEKKATDILKFWTTRSWLFHF